MFKDIELTKGKYAINEEGQVKRNETGKILKDHVNNKGYRYVDLRIDGKTKKFLVHRLVALTFIPNQDPSKTIINHKDCNPLNCHVSNLEWCDYSRNLQYAYDLGRMPITERQMKARRARKYYLHKKIYQYTIDGEFVAEYESVTEAAKAVGASHNGNISSCALGKAKSSMGYIWKYEKV